MDTMDYIMLAAVESLLQVCSVSSYITGQSIELTIICSYNDIVYSTSIIYYFMSLC
jgi:hypothetical protein